MAHIQHLNGGKLFPARPWAKDALQEALCCGWIDSRVKAVDAERFSVRFTPRRPGSPWSKRNLAFAEALLQSGKMTEAGIAVLPLWLRRKTGS